MFKLGHQECRLHIAIGDDGKGTAGWVPGAKDGFQFVSASLDALFGDDAHVFGVPDLNARLVLGFRIRLLFVFPRGGTERADGAVVVQKELAVFGDAVAVGETFLLGRVEHFDAKCGCFQIADGGGDVEIAFFFLFNGSDQEA